MAIATSTAILAAAGASAVSSIASGNAAKRQAGFQAAATQQETARQAQIIAQTNEQRARVLEETEEVQAKIQKQQAAREIEIASAEEEDFRRRQSRTLAQRRADLGASGVEVNTGTPILTTSDFVTEAELQALRIRAGGKTRADRLEQEADFGRFTSRKEAALLRSSGDQQSDLISSAGRTQATLTRAAGKSAQTRGFFRAGSSLLGGVSRIDFGGSSSVAPDPFSSSVFI